MYVCVLFMKNGLFVQNSVILEICEFQGVLVNFYTDIFILGRFWHFREVFMGLFDALYCHVP